MRVPTVLHETARLEFGKMTAICVRRQLILAIGATLMIVAGTWSTRGLADDPKATSRAAGSDSTSQDSVKIEPYTGPPIYLEEPEQVAKPTIVTRQTIREPYEDGKTPRVEREVAHYSDNNFAADGKYLEFYPDGKPFIDGRFKAGRQEGEWSYFFDNGQLNRKAMYEDGKPNGSWEIYRADGTLQAKRGFKDGLRDGEWSSFDASGKQQLSEEHYVKGEENGVWKTWFPNGKQKQEVSFKMGKRDGKSTEWNDKGEKVIEIEYANNKLNGTVTRYLAGGKKTVQKFKDNKFVSESKE
jgi:antitoxin component YwqK of YwqJK toxin-antitoxin module